MQRAEVYALIDAERSYQDEKWGGGAHDQTHPARDWAIYLHKHFRRFQETLSVWVPNTLILPRKRAEARKHLLRVAALCVAALEHAPDLQLEATESPRSRRIGPDGSRSFDV